MNAKAPAVITEPELALLPLAAIAPSDNAVQARRRRRFTEAAIAELADNIAQQSLLQPILVRPIGKSCYEIVAGERRFLAHQRLQRENITAIIRAIDDRDVIGLQLSENLNRETLHPLDESEGYALLMKPEADGGQGLSADQVAEAMGVSRRQVFNRLKLLNMAPAVQEALEAGTLDTSKALLIARLPTQKLQKKAMEHTTGYNGRPLSLRDFADALRREFMVSLKDVPFALDDAGLKPLACTACPNCSANDPELQAELDGELVCTDKPCHDRKAIQFFERRVQRAKEAGRPVIEGAEAKALKPKTWSAPAGLVDLDHACMEIQMPEGLTDEQADDWQPPTYRSALGLEADQVPEQAVLFIDPQKHEPCDMVPAKDLQKLLKARGIKYTVSRAEAPEVPESPEQIEARRREQEKEHARDVLETEYRRALFRQIHAKWKGALKKAELAQVADLLLDASDGVDALYADTLIETHKMDERELCALLVCMTLERHLHLHESAQPLVALAKRLKIDPAKVKKQAKAELDTPKN